MPDLLELPAVQTWRADSACREVDDPSIFFPERGVPADRAKAVCRRCLVQVQCLEFALKQGLTEGIYGGLTGKERLRIIRQRKAAAKAAAW